MEQFIIVLALLLASALYNWWSSRNRQDAEGGPEGPVGTEDHTTAPPPREAAPRTRREVNWEEELRRLLQGESAPPPARPVPPPLPPVPPPTPARPARVSTTLKTPPALPRYRRPAPPPVPAAGALLASEVEGPRAPHLASLQQSAAAYERAGMLHSRTADHLKASHVIHPAAIVAYRETDASRDAQQLVRSLRRPGSIRQAIMASIVFGPPKALE